MRRWHSRLAPWFCAFLLLIALTGLGIEATDLLDRKPAEGAARTVPAGTAVLMAAPQVCPPAKSRRSELGQWNHWLKKVHSGEIAGPVGAALNLATGAALLFFAGSGLWMYATMAFRRRRVRRG